MTVPTCEACGDDFLPNYGDATAERCGPCVRLDRQMRAGEVSADPYASYEPCPVCGSRHCTARKLIGRPMLCE